MKLMVSLLFFGGMVGAAQAATPQTFRVVNGAQSYKVEMDKSSISVQSQKMPSKIQKVKCGKDQVAAMQKILDFKLKRLVEVKSDGVSRLPFYIQKDDKKFIPAPGTAGREFFEDLPSKMYAFQLALKRTCRK